MGLAVQAFWLEPASLRTQESELAIPNWPAECDGLRVAVLTDLHVGSPFNGLPKLERILAETRAAEPDVILLAGDYVIHGVLGGSYEPPQKIAKVLGKLAKPAAVYAVLGNHDWWLGADEVEAALEAAAIPVLEDEALEVEAIEQGGGACRFWLAGVSDYWEGAHDIAKALRPVPAGAPVVLFTHNPDIFPGVPDRVSLTVAGHTHGGQVNFPGIGRPVVPSEHGERFAIGHIVEQGRHLFVSTGTGTSILPVRFRVPPEISLLTLRPGSP